MKAFVISGGVLTALGFFLVASAYSALREVFMLDPGYLLAALVQEQQRHIRSAYQAAALGEAIVGIGLAMGFLASAACRRRASADLLEVPESATGQVARLVRRFRERNALALLAGPILFAGFFIRGYAEYVSRSTHLFEQWYVTDLQPMRAYFDALILGNTLLGVGFLVGLPALLGVRMPRRR